MGTWGHTTFPPQTRGNHSFSHVRDQHMLTAHALPRSVFRSTADHGQSQGQLAKAQTSLPMPSVARPTCFTCPKPTFWFPPFGQLSWPQKAKLSVCRAFTQLSCLLHIFFRRTLAFKNGSLPTQRFRASSLRGPRLASVDIEKMWYKTQQQKGSSRWFGPAMFL